MNFNGLKCRHWVKTENSGLLRTALEFAHCEEKMGHSVSLYEPETDKVGGRNFYGADEDPDIHLVHSQLNVATYFDRKPKIMFCHGEPLSSVGNKISMKAIADLARHIDAMICMRKDELRIWESIKRATYLVPKGVDLDYYKPVDLPEAEMLPGKPAVIYCENWRRERNPLMACVAMIQVWRRFPEAKLHLFNVTDQKMLDTFVTLRKQCFWSPFLHTIQGPQADVVKLYNRGHIVVTGLYPLFARTPVEALACGRGVVAAGYRDTDYPYNCEFHPDSMAEAIIKIWSEWGSFDFRAHAVKNHDAMESTRQAVEIYKKFL